MRKRRVVGTIYGMKFSLKGHNDRNRHKYRMKRRRQARLLYVKKKKVGTTLPREGEPAGILDNRSTDVARNQKQKKINYKTTSDNREFVYSRHHYKRRWGILIDPCSNRKPTYVRVARADFSQATYRHSDSQPSFKQALKPRLFQQSF